MFDVEIRRTFSAAHQLKGYDGDCRNLHGHNYSVVVNVAAEKLNGDGIRVTKVRIGESENSAVTYSE